MDLLTNSFGHIVPSMESPMQSPSLMEASKLSSSTLSPNTTGTGADEDTIGSITKDFSDNFAHKFTPMTWSKSLNTPTPSQAYSINSNMSSVTYMKHAHFNNENDTPMADINQTPMRDLNPEYLYQDGPHVNCPLSVGSQVSNASLESPPVVKVLSPASQFRLKRAVFESKAKAVKSPNRKQRAQNVTVLDNSPSMAPVHMENNISPSCAIESELGDECEADVPLATAHALPMPMKVLDSIMHEGLDENDEKEEHGELQYEEPLEKEETEQARAVEPETIPQPEVLVVNPEILHVEALEESSSITTDRGISRPVLLFAAALIFALVCLGRVYFGTDDTVGAVSDHYAVMLETPGEVMQTDIATTLDLATEEYTAVSFVEEAQLSLSVTYKSALRLDARELPYALYVHLRELCFTQYAQLHTKIVEYDAQHGHYLQHTAVQLRGKADAYLAVLGESVVQFHHQIDAMGLRDEWLKLKAEVSTRVDQSGLREEFLRLKHELVSRIEQSGLPEEWARLKHEIATRAAAIDTSGLKSALEVVRREYALHAPVVKERVQEEMHKVQQRTLTNLLHMHRFIKENELLADEFY